MCPATLGLCCAISDTNITPTQAAKTVERNLDDRLIEEGEMSEEEVGGPLFTLCPRPRLLVAAPM